jgi:hypothetical protein
VTELAKWLKKSVEIVTGLCIDLANKGFVFYDRANQEVTIKQKTKDYIDSFAGKKDYDVMSIYSETKAPVDNAILDLKDFGLTINKEQCIPKRFTRGQFTFKPQITLGKQRIQIQWRRSGRPLTPRKDQFSTIPSN